MKHEHDFDLIADIAGGEMSPDEQRAAESSLCATCRIELLLQREALETLHSAPQVTMTDLERARVRRRVAETVFPPQDAPKPSAPWFQRLVPAMAAAAALLVVVGVGSVLINPSGEGDAAADTTAATEDLSGGDSFRTGIEEEVAEAPVADASADETPVAAELEDTAGAPTTTIAYAAPLEGIIEEFGSISSEALPELALSLGTARDEDGSQSYAPPSESAKAALVCAEAADAEGPVTAIGTATVDGDEVEIYRIGELVFVFSAADCALTETFE